jgi:hypothetical protein
MVMHHLGKHLSEDSAAAESICPPAPAASQNPVASLQSWTSIDRIAGGLPEWFHGTV